MTDPDCRERGDLEYLEVALQVNKQTNKQTSIKINKNSLVGWLAGRLAGWLVGWLCVCVWLLEHVSLFQTFLNTQNRPTNVWGFSDMIRSRMWHAR